MPEITGIGKAVITATVGSGKKYTMTVHVYRRTEDLENADVEELVVDKLLYELEVREYAHINTSVKPYYAWNNIDFESEDENIATVDENGVIKAVAVGETKIKVFEDASGKYATCIVKVGMKDDTATDDNSEKKNQGSPETGDGMGMGVLMIIAFVSIFVIIKTKSITE